MLTLILLMYVSCTAIIDENSKYSTFIKMKEMKAMSIKKIICIMLALTMISITAACGGENSNEGNNGGSTPPSESPSPGGENSGNSSGTGNGGTDSNTSNTLLTGPPVDILVSIEEQIRASDIQMPMTLPPNEVPPALSHNSIGVEEDDFTRLVVSAYDSVAAIGTFAHQIAVIQAKDSNAAGEIKRMISSPNGYDAQKWICVWPEVAFVVESGEYVLLVAANIDVGEAALEIFRTAAGTIGDVVTFFEFTGEQPGEAGGLMPIG